MIFQILNKKINNHVFNIYESCFWCTCFFRKYTTSSVVVPAPRPLIDAKNQALLKHTFVKTKKKYINNWSRVFQKDQDHGQNASKLFLKTLEPAKFCLVIINKTKNNSHCVLTNLFGKQKTLWSISGGQIKNGHKANGRRKTRYVQRMIYNSACAKILGLGFSYLVIHVKGTFVSKHYIFKTFSENLKIILLKDNSSVAHNGCRPSKKRRV